jgi:hypothetical protein
MVGDCPHPHIKGLNIQRHNDTVQQTIKCITQSPLLKIDCYIMDAGKDHLTGLNPLSSRLPHWLLPDTPPSILQKMRPDLLIIEKDRTVHTNHPENAHTYDKVTRGMIKVHLYEIGYTADTRYTDKLATKSQQHAELHTALTEAGWDVQPTQTLLFGIGGSIYTSVTKHLQQDLQIHPTTVQQHLHKIQHIACQRAHQMITTRRHLENKPG